MYAPNLLMIRDAQNSRNIYVSIDGAKSFKELYEFDYWNGGQTVQQFKFISPDVIATLQTRPDYDPPNYFMYIYTFEGETGKMQTKRVFVAGRTENNVVRGASYGFFYAGSSNNIYMATNTAYLAANNINGKNDVRICASTPVKNENGPIICDPAYNTRGLLSLGSCMIMLKTGDIFDIYLYSNSSCV
jgi:hypothetical protein